MHGQHILGQTLEALGDPYPILRERWLAMDRGDSLSVRYGTVRPRLRSRDVANLLWVAGFSPGRPRRASRGWEMDAVWSPRTERPLSCSIIVPCRNEIDNIGTLVERLPAVGTHTELIFVDGASTDGTPEAIEALIASHPDRDIRLLRQHDTGGKASAVFLGFDDATGDVLMILDADITVAPEDLPRFHAVLSEGIGGFVNGTRFVLPMDEGAMPGANNVGNRTFSFILSWLLGARITDSLCGTKALLREDWPAVREARRLFGMHDPWGDFDLLFGAAYVGLPIVDVPIRYGARTAGESKMQPLRGGSALLRTCFAGLRQLKLSREGTQSRGA